MATPNATANVDTGRPKVGGYAFRGPIGTPTPENATGELNAGLLNMGYVGQSGLQATYGRTTTDHKDWNGDIVETTQDEYNESYTCEFIESLRGDLLKALFGSENVTITPPTEEAEGSIKIKHNAVELEPGAWVFEMKSRRSGKRIVLDNAKITEIGEVSFVANDLIRYPATIKAYPNEDGDTSLEYKTLPKLPATGGGAG